jgi:alcohol oxidase
VVEHIQPARYFRSLALPSDTFTFHKSKPVKGLRDREPIVPTGRALGGGSSVNCGYTINLFLVRYAALMTVVLIVTMYTRAAASDYDDWETVHGNKGWHSKYIIPLLKKVKYIAPGCIYTRLI